MKKKETKKPAKKAVKKAPKATASKPKKAPAVKKNTQQGKVEPHRAIKEQNKDLLKQVRACKCSEYSILFKKVIALLEKESNPIAQIIKAELKGIKR